MKGVILSGGTGSRLRPITFSMAKQLVPVANKPILYYGIEDMAAAGITEAVIIISPQTGAEVKKEVGNGDKFGMRLEYVVQDEPLGLAHALKTALPAVGGDDMLMYLGDNLIKGGVTDVVDDYRSHNPNCQILVTPVDDPSSFGVAVLDEAGRVTTLIEKPQNPPSNLALVGAYIFDQTIAQAIDAIQPSARGEFEITDAIQWLVTNNFEVRPSVVRNWWKDTGKKDDLIHANQLVLSDLQEDIQGEVIGGELRGAVSIEKGALLVDCQVSGPVVIGANARLTRTILGPYTAVGADCTISDGQIENSIIMSGSEIHGWRLRDSLIGKRARVTGAAPSAWVEMTLGERSEVDAE